jgi:pilus assembly protein CpaB
MKRRLLAIALALLLAATGTGAVLAYVSVATTRAMTGLKAVSVLVAQREIPSGTSAAAAIQDGALRDETLPARSLPSDALGSITVALGSLVMSFDVKPGQVLLRPMLVPAAQTSGGLEIPSGMVAVTIPLCLPEAVAGYVQAGSQVAVFDTVSSKSMSSQESCSQSGQSQQTQASGDVQTRVVLPRVQVLAVGQAGSGQGRGGQGGSGTGAGNQPQGSVLLTLAVNQANAERVIRLTETGLPYLALLTPASRTGFDAWSSPLFQQ